MTIENSVSSERKEAIRAPKFEIATFLLRGTAPYVSNKFSEEAREMMRAKQALGGQAKALKPVIVRTYSAGAHFGYLVKRDGKEVTLERSRRLWRWFGAWTLSEVATSGVDVSKSKIGAPVNLVLTEAIEVIDCTPAAVVSLESAKWAQ